MARFVLAGKADCPYYAKAEYLAEKCQKCLPDFSIRKIPILPEQWQDWLEKTCETHGWRHHHSPVIWRDVGLGCRGILLGGLSDFMEHCQAYYNLTAEMSSELMLKISEENMAAMLDQTREEQERLKSIRPLQVWICSALSPVAPLLIPDLLLDPEFFPLVSQISLHLLDVHSHQDQDQLCGLQMEVQDLAAPRLHQVTVHSALDEAFTNADLILFLDDERPSKKPEASPLEFRRNGEEEEHQRTREDEEGHQKTTEKEEHQETRDEEEEHQETRGDEEERQETRGDEEEQRRTSEQILEQYRQYGRRIESSSRSEVRVLLFSSTRVNLKCSALLENCPTKNKRNFLTVASHLEKKARVLIAEKLGVRTQDVQDVAVWGDVCGHFYIDIERAQVLNLDRGLMSPPSVPLPLTLVQEIRRWCDSERQELVRLLQGSLCPSAAMSSAHAVLSVLKAWDGPGTVLSVGLDCSGLFEVPNGVVLSVPVQFSAGSWTLLPNLDVDKKLRDKLLLCSEEFSQVGVLLQTE